MPRRIPAVALAALACGGVLPVQAAALRKPTPLERATIAQAVRIPSRCLQIRVATVRPGWATAALGGEQLRSCDRYQANGVVVLRRRDGIWLRRFAGSSWSCPIAGVPEAVRRDLRLACPEGGG